MQGSFLNPSRFEEGVAVAIEELGYRVLLDQRRAFISSLVERWWVMRLGSPNAAKFSASAVKGALEGCVSLASDWASSKMVLAVGLEVKSLEVTWPGAGRS